jgi:hypothetical protein
MCSMGPFILVGNYAPFVVVSARKIGFKDIVELCPCPENLVFLYAGPAARLGLPWLPDEYALKLQQIMA